MEGVQNRDRAEVKEVVCIESIRKKLMVVDAIRSASKGQYTRQQSFMWDKGLLSVCCDSFQWARLKRCDLKSDHIGRSDLLRLQRHMGVERFTPAAKPPPKTQAAQSPSNAKTRSPGRRRPRPPPVVAPADHRCLPLTACAARPLAWTPLAPFMALGAAGAGAEKASGQVVSNTNAIMVCTAAKKHQMVGLMGLGLGVRCGCAGGRGGLNLKLVGGVTPGAVQEALSSTPLLQLPQAPNRNYSSSTTSPRPPQQPPANHPPDPSTHHSRG